MQDSNASCNTGPFYKGVIKFLNQFQSRVNSEQPREDYVKESIIISLEDAISPFYSLVDKGVCYTIPNSERITLLDICVNQLVDNHRKIVHGVISPFIAVA
ncbi:hypothetical protein [Wolbachia endosymbiont of Brugia pahangi]|uniref:hypothetical protein n=1 Tax=Wolbachia endosymbiont of Brugia pahangi TaxID=96495 RepID=UPI001435C2C6|nr:hypothetical protein [Wolbachia endosymbiont of Brugia pahangi]QIT36502.1 hypothetical protein WBP_0041 [Wolbachia endosymbiont of Brugia pahangi]